MSFRTKHVFFAAFGLMTLFVFYLYETPFVDSQSPVWQHDEPAKWLLLFHRAPRAPLGRRVEPVKWLRMCHSVGGVVALVLAPFQFSARLRRRGLRLHRIMG